jgi:hypothetical protein
MGGSGLSQRKTIVRPSLKRDIVASIALDTPPRADLQVFEGLSHAQYTINPDAPETREAFEEIARFFDRHMQR